MAFDADLKRKYEEVKGIFEDNKVLFSSDYEDSVIGFYDVEHIIKPLNELLNTSNALIAEVDQMKKYSSYLDYNNTTDNFQETYTSISKDIDQISEIKQKITTSSLNAYDECKSKYYEVLDDCSDRIKQLNGYIETYENNENKISELTLDINDALVITQEVIDWKISRENYRKANKTIANDYFPSSLEAFINLINGTAGEGVLPEGMFPLLSLVLAENGKQGSVQSYNG